MKVLIYSTYQGPHHLEAEMEIIQNHIEQGDDVHILTCKGELKNSGCVGNPERLKSACFTCISRHEQAFKVVGAKKENIHILPKTRLKEKFKFNNINELSDFEKDGFDVGAGVASSLIFYKEKSNINVNRIEKEVNHSINTSFHLYQFFLSFLKQNKFDHIFFFNGRFLEQLPLLRVCQKLKLPFQTHERGGSLLKYMLFKNTLPHDRSYFTDKANQLWNVIKSEKVIHEVKKWYQSRREGTNKNTLNLNSKQIQGQVPIFNLDKTNIIIFNTSSDEFSSLGKDFNWHHRVFLDHYKNIDNVLKYFEERDTHHFYLRIHPNLITKKEELERLVKFKSYSCCTVIEPSSEIDTYTLMEKANAVLSFCSTTGVEATYWGTTSILAGHAMFEELGVVYRPDDFIELYSMLENPPKPLPKEGALKYSAFLLFGGIDFKNYKATSYKTGLYQGKAIRASKKSYIQALLLRFLECFYTASPTKFYTDIKKVLYSFRVNG